jgi:hypothetical protein
MDKGRLQTKFKTDKPDDDVTRLTKHLYRYEQWWRFFYGEEIESHWERRVPFDDLTPGEKQRWFTLARHIRLELL